MDDEQQERQLAILQRLPISRSQQMELLRRLQNDALKLKTSGALSSGDSTPKVTRSQRIPGQLTESKMDTDDDESLHAARTKP